MRGVDPWWWRLAAGIVFAVAWTCLLLWLVDQGWLRFLP